MTKSGNFQEHTYILKLLNLNLVCGVVHMEGVKYINLIEIGMVVIKIQGVENGKLAVPLHKTIVPHAAFWLLTHNCMS